MSNQVLYIDPDRAGPPQGLYSHVTQMAAGNLLFIAGQLSVDSTGARVGQHDFRAQFHQVFANLGIVLTDMGCPFDHVVKFTTYLVHSQDIELFMEERESLFPKIFSTSKYPPNTLLIVDRLVHEDFLVEIEAVARAAD